MKHRTTSFAVIFLSLSLTGCALMEGPTLQPTYSAESALKAAGITFEPTATPVLPTLTPTPDPSISLKGGAHTLYGNPEVGFPIAQSLKSDQAVEIVGRSADSAWLQIQTSVHSTAWIPAVDFEISGEFDLNQFPQVDPYPLVAPALLEWKGSPIQSLCVSEQTSFIGTYAAENPAAIPQPVLSADILAVMHAAGIKTVAAGGTCDATLQITTTIDPRGKQFTEAVSGLRRYCYSGVNVDSAWLVTQGDTHLTFNLKKQRGTRETQITCNREGTYDDELALVMHTGLDRLWGAAALTPMLQIYNREMNRNAIYLAGAGGRHRMDTVPALLTYLSDPDLADNALSALKTITGKGFTNDLYTWTTWWEDKSTAPTPTP